VEAARLLEERSLDALLRQALDARVEGLVLVRDRDGARNGVWVQRGYIVGIHVAGWFDPLLLRLTRAGLLSTRDHGRCLATLAASDARSGELASTRFAVPASAVREVIALQLVERYRALRELCDTRGHDARLEARPVPASEVALRMPLGSLLRRAGTAAEPSDAETPAGDPGDQAQEARRALRKLARALHPDRHAHLDAGERLRLSRALARATAAYHGFS
jgi:hypothetical protein